MNTSTVKFTIETLDDSDPDTSYLSQDYLDVPDAAERQKYLAQDAARLAAYKRGDWHYIGVRARATITIHDSVARSTWQHDLTSWGYGESNQTAARNTYARYLKKNASSCAAT